MRAITQSEITFHNRVFDKVIVNDNWLIKTNRLKKRTATYQIAEIAGVEIKRSIYDIPIFERTVVINLKNGRKEKIKRLSRKKAAKLAETIERAIINHNQKNT